ncbi:MAG: HAD family hydrolase [Oscillospiraceae bacterium]|jgi:phosphoglycolate phosphatase|nr:HAD family hydrolase [Oscillospiraceae bacterium]
MEKGKFLAVFDLDGTLNQTHLFSVPAHRQALEEMGFPPKTDEEIMNTFGMIAADYLKVLLPEGSEAVGREYLHRVAVLEYEFITSTGKAYEGVPELLDALKARGFSTAVCSNASHRYISFVLNALGLAQKIDYIQPIIDGMTKVETLGVLLKHVAPAHAVMVGDTAYDIKAGTENGLPTIGCLYGFRPWELDKASFTVNTPLEALPIIEEISKKLHNF